MPPNALPTRPTPPTGPAVPVTRPQTAAPAAEGPPTPPEAADWLRPRSAAPSPPNGVGDAPQAPWALTGDQADLHWPRLAPHVASAATWLPARPLRGQATGAAPMPPILPIPPMPPMPTVPAMPPMPAVPAMPPMPSTPSTRAAPFGEPDPRDEVLTGYLEGPAARRRGAATEAWVALLPRRRWRAPPSDGEERVRPPALGGGEDASNGVVPLDRVQVRRRAALGQNRTAATPAPIPALFFADLTAETETEVAVRLPDLRGLVLTDARPEHVAGPEVGATPGAPPPGPGMDPTARPPERHRPTPGAPRAPQRPTPRAESAPGSNLWPDALAAAEAGLAAAWRERASFEDEPIWHPVAAELTLRSDGEPRGAWRDTTDTLDFVFMPPLQHRDANRAGQRASLLPPLFAEVAARGGYSAGWPVVNLGLQGFEEAAPRRPMRLAARLQAPNYASLLATTLTAAEAEDALCPLSLEPLEVLEAPVAVRCGAAVHVFEFSWLMDHWTQPGCQNNPVNRQPLEVEAMLRVVPAPVAGLKSPPPGATPNPATTPFGAGRPA